MTSSAAPLGKHAPVQAAAPIVVRLLRQPALAALLAAVVLAAFNAAMTGPVLMGDNDSMLRLVQVRDLLAGQNWFDMTQTRMGPPGGFEMHWSRLIDAPIAGLIIAGQAAGLSTPGAEALAVWLWPVLLSFAAFYGAFGMARNFGDAVAMALAAVMAVAAFQLLGMFAYGAIDHHNAQIALALLALMAITSQQSSAGGTAKTGYRAGALAGICLALMAGIGVETQLHVALGAAAVAAFWVLHPGAWRHFAMAFGVAFAAVMLCVFVGTIAPSQYGRTVCDAFSVAQALPGAVGGLALAAAAYACKPQEGLSRRLAWLGGAAALTGIAALPFSTGCLQNPLAGIDPLVYDFWLRHIEEAKPLALVFAEDMTVPLAVIMPTVLAIGICGWFIVSNHNRVAGIVVGGALAISLALAFYQFRTSMMAAHLAVPVLAAWVAMMWRWADGPGKWLAHRLVFVLALFASLSHSWAFVAIGTKPLRGVVANANTDKGSQTCESPAFLADLNRIAPGTLMTVSNLGPDVLIDTRHRVVTGPYHRNIDGIKAAINAHILPAAEARAAFRAMGATHLVWCPALVEITIFAREGGLAADLLAGRVPAWLVPAIIAPDGSYVIYSVEK
ncbi:MAG: hypothetical protein HC779_04105 [Phyllobacteriaceae bacterium]|nr:hypothetical protein [Phyllobacteriaceae bacterium]